MPLLDRLIYSLSERRQRSIVAVLKKRIDVSYPDPTPLEHVLKTIKERTARLYIEPAGIPIYVDPVGFGEEGVTLQETVVITSKGTPLEITLTNLLKPLGLSYYVNDGLMTITSERQVAEVEHARAKRSWPP